MNWDFNRLLWMFAVAVLIGLPSEGPAVVRGDDIDTPLAKKTVSGKPCGVCHSKPDYEGLAYDKWTELIKIVPDRMMPVKGSTERSRVIQAIESGEANGFYRSRCSNCHDMPDPATLSADDWRGRLFELSGMEMPVMSPGAKRSVLSELAAANDRRSNYNPRSDWFELPNSRRKAPLPSGLKEANAGTNLLLHFWSPGCTPCREELPEFKQFVRSLADTFPLEVRVIAVTRKEAETLELLEPIPKNRVYFDNSKALTNRLNVGSFPTNYLIGRDGKFIARMVGRRPWHKGKFKQALVSLLQEPGENYQP